VAWTQGIAVLLALGVGLLPASGSAQVGDTERWVPLSTTGNPGARREHAAVWSGTELLVVGGTSCGGRCGPGPIPPPGWRQGGRYNTVTNTWRSMADPPTTSIDAAVWDGSEMLTFGEGGLAYDPVRDAWRTLPATGAPAARTQGVVVWTGAEMLVWGGSGAAGDFADGARFNPTTNTWRPISPNGAPGPRFNPVGVWTGSQLLVWGGQDVGTALSDGAAYDPATDTWVPISSDGEPTLRSAAAGVWSGSELLIWGGTASPGAILDGARYDPALDRWATIATDGGPDQAVAHTAAVWDGFELLIWVNDHGMAYDPAADRWRPLPTQGAPSPRISTELPLASVWTGAEWIIWGGLSLATLETLDDGAGYFPPPPPPPPGPVPSK
jgi:Kelch motif